MASINPFSTAFADSFHKAMERQRTWRRTNSTTIAEVGVPHVAGVDMAEGVVTKVDPTPAAPATPIAAPLVATVDVKGVDLEEYELLSMEVGYKSAELEYKKLALFLQREEIVVYNRDDVEKYLVGDLNKEVGREREKYMKTIMSPSSYNLPFHTIPSYRSVEWRDIARYTKNVPIEALRMASRVRDGVDCELEFTVSEVVKNPDPFLAVNVKGDDHIFIIFKWDEPGFTVTPGNTEG